MFGRASVATILTLAGFWSAAYGVMAQPLDAQITFDPPQPQAGRPVTAHVIANMAWCQFSPQVLRGSDRVRIDLRLPNCPGEQQQPVPTTQQVAIAIGPLLWQGSYDIELYRNGYQSPPDLVASVTAGPPPDPTIDFIPNRPRQGQPVTARVTMLAALCTFAPSVTVTPGNVQLELRLPGIPDGCDPQLPEIQTLEIALGSLPAGAHNVRVFRRSADEPPILIAPLMVAGASEPVPALSLPALASLLLLLLAFACVTFRRQGLA